MSYIGVARLMYTVVAITACSVQQGAHHNDLFAQEPPIIGRITRFAAAGADAR